METGHDASWARPGEADPGRAARQGNNELAVQRAATALESLRLLLGVLAEQRAVGREGPEAVHLVERLADVAGPLGERRGGPEASAQAPEATPR